MKRSKAKKIPVRVECDYITEELKDGIEIISAYRRGLNEPIYKIEVETGRNYLKEPCEDCISRKQAIETLNMLIDNNPDCEEWNKAIQGAINDLKHHVPSVTPLRKKDEWHPVRLRRMTKEEQAEYKIQERRGGFFSYSWDEERYIWDGVLPDTEGDYLVTGYNGTVTLALFCQDSEFGPYFEGWEDEGEIVAWKPLPEPFRKGAE